MLSKKKYARLTDLYTVGTELVLSDGTVIYLKIMNPFEREEAMHDAQVARARFVLMMKDDSGSDELLRVQGMFAEAGRDGAIALLLDTKRSDTFIQILDEMRVDEQWREKAELVLRADDLASAPTQEEKDHLAKVELEFRTEMSRRITAADEYEKSALRTCSDDELWEQYKDWWLDTHGTEKGMVEYRLTEMWFACRVCEGVQVDGEWDHSACEGHNEQVFSSKDEIKHLPEQLQLLIRDAMAELDMGEREAKNSDRQESSSESSLLPSVPVDSDTSTQEPTSEDAPGPLPPLSPTP